MAPEQADCLVQVLHWKAEGEGYLSWELEAAAAARSWELKVAVVQSWAGQRSIGEVARALQWGAVDSDYQPPRRMQ